MEYILLDTNLLIYREGERPLENNVQTLSRLLMDSNIYKLCVHPLSIKELKKYKNEKEKKTILSKIGAYNILESPPIMSDDFDNRCGKHKNNHDLVDNSLLYAVYRNCVSYFITNDKGIIKKSEKIGLRNQVLTIDEGIEILYKEEKNSLISSVPFIEKKPVESLDLNDHFFDSLRQDYYHFDFWFNKKARQQEKALVTYKSDGTLGALLMYKIEDESEDYDSFDLPFQRGKRVKIQTFKVTDNGKLIGEAFIKNVLGFALNQNIDEIYVTIFEKQERLIELLLEYGFKFFTYKNTKRENGRIEKESVYVKSMNFVQGGYPLINIKNQDIYLIPIQDRFAQMLFPDAFENYQLSFDDVIGKSTYGIGIKKAYLSGSKIKGIKKDDILVFYISQTKKSIACVGVVDDAFRSQELNGYQLFKEVVSRRTVYDDKTVEDSYNRNNLTIMFKYYLGLKRHISLNEAIEKKIIKGPPQSIQAISQDSFRKIIELSGDSNQILFNTAY